MNCPHYDYALCAHCFRALTASQQATIQQADGSVAAFRASQSKPLDRPSRARR